jgi:mRNA-degrading endonuclease toxin of MazEF toxin-antitoxin module
VSRLVLEALAIPGGCAALIVAFSKRPRRYEFEKPIRAHRDYLDVLGESNNARGIR